MAEYRRVVIVGVGLLGGSIGLGLRKRHLADCVIGVGRSSESLQAAAERGAVDVVESDLSAACAGADLAIICTPVKLVEQYVLKCQQVMPPGGLITDVGSTKGGICEGLQQAAATSFCGSHPLAGSEKSGVAFAEDDLLQGRLTIVTPLDNSPNALVERTEQLWQALGSRTLRMQPEEHDRAVAQTSHLPHVVASVLASSTPDQLLPLAASGWCDTTRVAAGSADLWRQILEENREPVLHALEQFSLSLEEWMAALHDNDGKRLETLLQAGKQKRDSVGN
jgi:prephenate dehydrogenase